MRADAAALCTGRLVSWLISLSPAPTLLSVSEPAGTRRKAAGGYEARDLHAIYHRQTAHLQLASHLARPSS